MATFHHFDDGRRRSGLLNGVVDAVNAIEDPAVRATVVSSLKTHLPVVRWFTNSRGRVEVVDD